MKRLFQKKEITLLVTDSGLGGLSVCAQLEQGFRLQGHFKKVRLIFANALPEVTHPYNAMDSREEQLQVLDAALTGMFERFRPDLMLIACNTLSALFPETRFAKIAPIPVIGIIEFGTRMIVESLQQNPSSSAILLGTPTTIKEGAHRKRLSAAGIAADRIVYQACPNLEAEIQTDPQSDLVQSLIEAYTGEALSRFTKPLTGPMVVALCCSHYGYSKDLFQRVIKGLAGTPIVVLDPNREMSRFLLQHGTQRQHQTTGTSVKVFSRALLSDQEQQAIAALLTTVSPATADALKNYHRQLDLFPFPIKRGLEKDE